MINRGWGQLKLIKLISQPKIPSKVCEGHQPGVLAAPSVGERAGSQQHSVQGNISEALPRCP